MSKISDIAKAAGVSTATVSRAFNHHPYVDEALRDKIIEIGLDMGYAPSVSTMRRNFGIMFGSYNFSSYQRQLLNSLSAGIFSKGYNLQIVNLPQMRFAHKNTYRGMFLLSGMPDEYLEMLQKLDIPILFVNAIHQGFRSVCTDHKLGIELAMTHLIKNGHRRIAFLRAHKLQWGSDLREISYRETLTKYNMPLDPKLIAYFFDRNDTVKQTLKLMKQKPTALIVDGESNGLPVSFALQKAGIRVPEDISLICFEDEENTCFLNPPCTAIKQDFASLGQVAASIMLQLTATKNAGKIPENTIISGNELICRDSVKTLEL